MRKTYSCIGIICLLLVSTAWSFAVTTDVYSTDYEKGGLSLGKIWIDSEIKDAEEGLKASSSTLTPLINTEPTNSTEEKSETEKEDNIIKEKMNNEIADKVSTNVANSSVMISTKLTINPGKENTSKSLVAKTSINLPGHRKRRNGGYRYNVYNGKHVGSSTKDASKGKATARVQFEIAGIGGREEQKVAKIKQLFGKINEYIVCAYEEKEDCEAKLVAKPAKIERGQPLSEKLSKNDLGFYTKRGGRRRFSQLASPNFIYKRARPLKDERLRGVRSHGHFNTLYDPYFTTFQHPNIFYASQLRQPMYLGYPIHAEMYQISPLSSPHQLQPYIFPPYQPALGLSVYDQRSILARQSRYDLGHPYVYNEHLNNAPQFHFRYSNRNDHLRQRGLGQRRDFEEFDEPVQRRASEWLDNENDEMKFNMFENTDDTKPESMKKLQFKRRDEHFTKPEITEKRIKIVKHIPKYNGRFSSKKNIFSNSKSDQNSPQFGKEDMKKEWLWKKKDVAKSTTNSAWDAWDVDEDDNKVEEGSKFSETNNLMGKTFFFQKKYKSP